MQTVERASPLRGPAMVLSAEGKERPQNKMNWDVCCKTRIPFFFFIDG